MKRLVLTAVALAPLLATTTAHAGSQYESAVCEKAKDGSGRCMGTMRGFRNHSNPSTMANFSNQVYFQAFYPNSAGVIDNYLCGVNMSNSYWADVWKIALNFSGRFIITWDSTGQCTGLRLDNESAARQF